MAWPPTTHQDVQDEVTALRSSTAVTGAAILLDTDGNPYYDPNAVAGGGSVGFGAPLISVPVFVGPRVGEWITQAASALDQYSVADGWVRLGPMWLPAGTYDGLAFQVSIAGSAGALLRPVIYADDGTGQPGARALDVAAVDATTTGRKEITGLSLGVPSSGSLLWCGLAIQGGAATRPSYQRVAGTAMPTSGTSFLNAFYPGAWEMSGVTGTVPATASGFSRSDSYARVAFRRSA